MDKLLLTANYLINSNPLLSHTSYAWNIPSISYIMKAIDTHYKLNN